MPVDLAAFPIHNARFRNARTYHRIRRPDDHDWHALMEAACGKTGYLCTGYPMYPPSPCLKCYPQTAQIAA